MRTHARKTWPPFAVAVVLALLGLFILDGAAAGVVLFLAFAAVIGGCINGVRGEDVPGGFGHGGGTF